jgi:hypothetical protein
MAKKGLSTTTIALICVVVVLVVVAIILGAVLGSKAAATSAQKAKLREVGPALAGGLGLASSTNTIPGPLNQFPITGIAAAGTQYVHGKILAVSGTPQTPQTLPPGGIPPVVPTGPPKPLVQGPNPAGSTSYASLASIPTIPQVPYVPSSMAIPAAPPANPSMPSLASMRPPKIASANRIGGNLSTPPQSVGNKITSMDPAYARAVAAAIAAPQDNSLDTHFTKPMMPAFDAGPAPNTPPPTPTPTPPAPLTPPPPTTLPPPSSPQTLTAAEAVALLNSFDYKVVIVVMDGCGGCETMKKLVASMLQQNLIDGRRIAFLPRDEWMQVREVFPTTAVPQLFRVGKGRAEKGPSGAPNSVEGQSLLVEFINGGE